MQFSSELYPQQCDGNASNSYWKVTIIKMMITRTVCIHNLHVNLNAIFKGSRFAELIWWCFKFLSESNHPVTFLGTKSPENDSLIYFYFKKNVNVICCLETCPLNSNNIKGGQPKHGKSIYLHFWTVIL